MTNYHLKAIIPPSIVAKARKAARKKLLEEVRARRRLIYRQFRKRMQKAYIEFEEETGC